MEVEHRLAVERLQESLEEQKATAKNPLERGRLSLGRGRRSRRPHKSTSTENVNMNSYGLVYDQHHHSIFQVELCNDIMTTY